MNEILTIVLCVSGVSAVVIGMFFFFTRHYKIQQLNVCDSVPEIPDRIETILRNLIAELQRETAFPNDETPRTWGMTAPWGTNIDGTREHSRYREIQFRVYPTTEPSVKFEIKYTSNGGIGVAFPDEKIECQVKNLREYRKYEKLINEIIRIRVSSELAIARQGVTQKMVQFEKYVSS